MPPQTPKAIRSLYVSLVLTTALAAILMIGSIWLGVQMDEESGWVRHTLAVRNKVAEVTILVQRAESNERGFLLNGDPAFVTSYDETIAALPKALDQLAALTIDNPAQVANVGKVRSSIADKIDEMDGNIADRKAGRFSVTAAAGPIGRGRQLMADVRRILSSMESEEDRLLAVRQQSVTQMREWLQVGDGITFLLICAIGGLISYFTRRSFTELATARDQLVFKNQELMEQVSKREEAEGQLRQSQKMEAVGQLTGGIAHDFNNMLGVITGSLDLMRRRIDKNDFRIERFIEAAQKAAARSAALTHRLLAFARQQPLEPKAVDVNRLIAGMSDLLRTTLGEQIRVEVVSAAGLWKTNIDPHQLESATLNVALNARDAMPEGGKLTIETANAYLEETYAKQHDEVMPGQYVMVAISDTGGGMSADVAARAFDPFFTTKPTGKGTGLGLSQVYGFVKQSRGHIKIYSEVGAGTTIKLYLPRLMSETESIEQPRPQVVRVGTQDDVILVVEDDALMGRLTTDALAELGYTVLFSDSAAAALAVLDKRTDIALLFTDVVMPEVNGKQLADEARRRRPGLKVLFTTGYTPNAVVHGGVLDAGVNFLSKPFAIEQLAAKVRAVLDT